MKDVSVMTEPPEKLTYSDNVTQYIIYKAYIDNPVNPITHLSEKFKEKKPSL